MDRLRRARVSAGAVLVLAGAVRRRARAAAPAGPAVADCLTQALCYAPRQFRVAYGIQPLLDDGRHAAVPFSQ